MVDSLTLVAAQAIAKIALDKFVEGGAGELGKKLTEKITALVQKLGQLVWHRAIKGKPEAEKVLAGAEQQVSDEVQKLTNYLNGVWQRDPDLAKEVQQLVQEIHQEITICQEQGGEVWNVYGGKAEKNEFIDNKAPIIKDNTGTISITYGTPPQA